jgi:hypothetical protein
MLFLLCRSGGGKWSIEALYCHPGGKGSSHPSRLDCSMVSSVIVNRRALKVTAVHPQEAIERAAYLESVARVHRPDPIMIVAIPPFMIVPAYVKSLLCRSNSYDTPPPVALIQRSSNRWIASGPPSANDIAFEVSSIQKFNISFVFEELLPAGVSVITTFSVVQVNVLRVAAAAIKTQNPSNTSVTN